MAPALAIAPAMLTVIVDARTNTDRATGLLAQLTAGAVEGLVREVLLVGPREGLIEALCEETGAEAAPSLVAAMERAQHAMLLVAVADFRLREGWIEAVQRHVADGARDALVRGLRRGPLSRPYAVLVERGRAVVGRDVDALRRQLGLRPARIG